MKLTKHQFWRLRRTLLEIGVPWETVKAMSSEDVEKQTRKLVFGGRK